MRAELIQLTVATLGRAPSPQEMTSWLAQLNSGTSLSALAQDLMFDEGGVGRFAGLSNTDILVNAYQALFGRLPDVSGLNYWLNEFAAGRVDLGNLVPSLLVGALASTGNSNDALILAARAQAANSFLQAAEESGVFNPQAAAQAVAAVLRSSVAEPVDEPSNLYNPNPGTPTGPEAFTVAEAVAIVADPSKALPAEYEISDIDTAFVDVAIADVPTPDEQAVISGATNSAEFVLGLKDTAANLSAAIALVSQAADVSATDAATVAQAELIADATNTGTTSFNIEDSLANLKTAAAITAAADKNGLAEAGSITVTSGIAAGNEVVTFDNLTADAAATSIDFVDNAVTLTAAEYNALSLATVAGDTITITMADNANVTGGASSDVFDYVGTEANASIAFFGAGDKVDLIDVNSAGTLTDMVGGVAMNDNAVFFLGGQVAGSADGKTAAATAISGAFNNDVDMTGSFVVVADDNSSVIYAVSNTGADNNDIAASDLTFVGYVDAVLTPSDILVA